ncbi:MAG: hypothetical protein LIP04_06750 [Tannerellaceae bacterium]|nr:hypothetical protein [Tannerellaceae bacterium]
MEKEPKSNKIEIFNTSHIASGQQSIVGNNNRISDNIIISLQQKEVKIRIDSKTHVITIEAIDAVCDNPLDSLMQQLAQKDELVLELKTKISKLQEQLNQQ